MAQVCEVDLCSLPDQERRLVARNLHSFIEQRLDVLGRQLAEAEARANSFAVKYGQDLNTFAERRLPETQDSEEYGDYVHWFMSQREVDEYRRLLQEYRDLARQLAILG
ncbi:hypothetical protein [Gelria sp. Kuro-4]|uniref:hypothetical protein n=1 Tax=Gelria sp. Kuro-4 TaxID=2796927 RepID=UPI001BF151B1|nr:hypothetical protein [Gelria sp. Kuro-4]BCV24335.1 hypothetical protein kuro4_11080 [Gelria sp. Kuro-4]